MSDKSFKAIMEHFKKAGDFAPELVNVGGALRPQESDKFIDLTVRGKREKAPSRWSGWGEGGMKK